VIIFEHVTKRYPGGTVAVDDLSLEVPDGCSCQAGTPNLCLVALNGSPLA
jgi:osmoprotectant transport system ATP-binding protein